MSRIGKSPIAINPKVKVSYDSNTRLFSASGTLGSLNLTIHPAVSLEISDTEIKLLVKNPENKKQRSIWGTTRSLIFNLIQGVDKGYQKQLELNGVGYKMEIKGDKLKLNLGFSHPVDLDIPKNVSLKIEKNILTGTSIDKQALGDFLINKIFSIRPCEVYKHKGFKVVGRYYQKKVVNKK